MYFSSLGSRVFNKLFTISLSSLATANFIQISAVHKGYAKLVVFGRRQAHINSSSLRQKS